LFAENLIGTNKAKYSLPLPLLAKKNTSKIFGQNLLDLGKLGWVGFGKIKANFGQK